MYDAIIVYSDLEEMIMEVDHIRKRDVPFILATTVNNLAFDAMDSLKKELKGKLNIKKKPLLSSFRIIKATKKTKTAELFVDNSKWQYKVLKHHFDGGDRNRKGLEKALIYKGFMNKGEILVGAKGLKVKKASYVRIMSQLQLNYKAGYDANETKRSKKRTKRRVKERYFVISSKRPSHLPNGIYAHLPGVPFPVRVLAIVRKPNYRKIFDLEETVEKVYNRRGNKHLGDAIDRALTLNAKRGWN